MERQALAVKYRPAKFEDVCEQKSTITILQNQLNTSTFKHAYLFSGPAGCGKTTCARIFANEINNGYGNPIEMDAASNSGVDDVRKIISQAQTQAIDSEFKVFIIDECHAISNMGWQAFLKLIEEPPAKSIFIFCTTDPQKIPATILSRVQRYQFNRISNTSIHQNLRQIAKFEQIDVSDDMDNALAYIANVANGGMRDAITLMDKCLSYDTELTVDVVNDILGNVGYSELLDFIEDVYFEEVRKALQFLTDKYMQGIDIKQFINQLYSTLLSLAIFAYTNNFELAGLPETKEIRKRVDDWDDNIFNGIFSMLDEVTTIKSESRWDTNPKMRLEAWIILRSQ